MRLCSVFMSCALGALGLSSAAMADTVATFADPSPTGATPLFNLTGNTFTGGWAGSGLTLQTPGLPSIDDFPNATFTLTPLTVTFLGGPFGVTNAGVIRFFDSNAALLLQIDFGSAVLTQPLSIGDSDLFQGHNVTFSGPIVANYAITNEQFAFSFANAALIPNGFTSTSAFTSSADLRIPGPATLASLGLGILLNSRRRR